MATILECPNCGKHLSVRDEFAGKAGKCPGCAETIQIPIFPRSNDSIAVQAVSLPPSPQPAAVRPPAISSPPVDGRIDVESWRSPSENIAAVMLWVFALPPILFLIAYTVCSFGLLLIIALIAWGARFIGQFWSLAYYKTNAVRVSHDQLPEINALVDAYAARLGIVRPEVYVVQHNVWNAFAEKLAGRHVVVLQSGAIDSLVEGGAPGDVAFLIGHELGHIAAGHLGWIAALRRLGAWFVWVGLWHRRHSELTCDRLALACCNDVNLAARALVNMTVGKTMASKVSVPNAIAQWQSHKSDFFVHYRTLYSLYPHNLCRLASIVELAQERGIG